MLDRFDAMVAVLDHRELPAPPALPGRMHECPDAPASADEIADAIACGCSAYELAAMAGITRAAAWLRLQKDGRHGG